jgi:diguanylate cyclase (GGDEF)-like protein/PAS domain S-box-containing protein
MRRLHAHSGWNGLLAGGVYFVFASLALVSHHGTGIACLSPATPWLLAMLMTRKRRHWPAILTGGAVASAAANLWFGLGTGWAFTMAATNTVEACTCLWLLRRLRMLRGTLESPGQLGWFVAIAGGIAPALNATFAAAYSAWALDAPYGEQWLCRYAGHALSVVALTPILSMLLSGEVYRWWRKAKRRQRVEGFGWLMATFFITVLVFGQSRVPLLFLPIVPVIFTTFRAGRVGAAMAAFIVAVAGGYATMNAVGPTVLFSDDPLQRIQFFQLYLGSTVLTTFPVAADLTRRRALYRQLRESEARYRLLADNSSDIVLGIDRSGRVDYISPSVEQLLGFAPDKLIGSKALRLVHPVDRDLVLQAQRDSLADPAGTQIVEYRGKVAQGGRRWFEAHTRAVTDDDGCVTSTVAIVRDVSHRKTLEADLSRAASTDPLTGLANRRAFDVALAREMNRAAAGMPGGCVALFDIDHFKRVNDQHGHDVGDRALQAFARIGRGVLRDEDLLARVGGEEFAILLPGMTIEQAHCVCERLRATLSATTIRDGELRLRLTVSAGIAAIGRRQSAAAVLRAADVALYGAKDGGRDRLELAA